MRIFKHILTNNLYRISKPIYKIDDIYIFKMISLENPMKDSICYYNLQEIVCSFEIIDVKSVFNGKRN